MNHNFHVYFSHNTNCLAEQLGKNIGNEGKKDIFQTTQILSPSAGMTIWITEMMTKDLGIFINYDCSNLGSWMNKVFKKLGGDNEKIKSKEQMIWLIFAALDNDVFKVSFPDVANYYKDQEQMQLSLATQIADLFDSYPIHRPEMIREWNKGKLLEKQSKETNVDKHEKWQFDIWQKIKNNRETNFMDASQVQDFIFDQIKKAEQQERLKKQFPAVHIFGISAFAPSQIELLHHLSQYIPIHIYMVNPSPEVYWIEDKNEKDILKLISKKKAAAHTIEGHPLLTNWGKSIQSTLALLYQKEEVMNDSEILHKEHSETNTQPTLLAAIQNDIYRSATDDIIYTQTQIEDKSIAISSHYSIIRELESLYNYLVEAIDELEGISPRDILVITTDIDAYAPYIKAVFDNAPVKIPYGIADEKVIKENSILSATVQLLELNEDKLTANHVLQLLENPYIRKRFGIDNLAVIKTAIEKAAIRFGFDNKKKDDTFLVSFNNGIKRLIYGICIGEEQEFDNAIPTDFSDNNADFQAILSFAQFVNQLEILIKEREGKKKLEDWKLQVEAMLDNFLIDHDWEKEEEYWGIMNKLLNNPMSSDITVSFSVYAHSLLKQLDLAVDAKSFLNYGITFCSPIPFRNIPFKIVAMLGMNFTTFPRKDRKRAFDLTGGKEQLGDRNTKSNDRYLFLETLLSAQSKLYLSYLGKNNQNNKDLEPSLLIDELVEYIQKHSVVEDVRKELFTQHPLHSFSEQYNQSEDLLNYYTSNQGSKPGLKKKAQEASPPITNEEIKEISIKDIELFCESPIKYYYQKVLGIYLNNKEDNLADSEYFELDGLQKWKLKDDYLKLKLGQKDLEQQNQQVEKDYKKGMFPLKNLKEALLKKDIFSIVDKHVKELKDVELVSYPINDLKIKEYKITGVLEFISTKNEFYFIVVSNDKPKYNIKCYIRYLLANSVKEMLGVKYFTGNKTTKVDFKLMQPDESKKQLGEIIQLMQEGTKECIPYIYDISGATNEKEYESNIYIKLNDIYSVPDDYLEAANEIGLMKYEEAEYNAIDEVLSKQINEFFKTEKAKKA